MEEADKKERQLTLPEQFGIAMELSSGSVLGAAAIACAGSRSIARGSDSRADPRFNYTEEEVRKWRDCVGHFEGVTEEYGDPTADNYHVWGTFIAGLLSETGDRTRDKIFNPIYRQIYTKTAEITELIRYRIGRKKGVTHKNADTLGYHLGSLVGSTLLSSQ
ncbi:MAG: hypothetical protein HYV38_03570 [Candidatus Levybacteria bacterium]|nr:hypothetical protein [Candidatus Levybacteria bacterium]